MNYEYNASGGININKTTHCKIIINYSVECPTEFIIMPIMNLSRSIHTGHYSILSNGSIATGGFNDKELKNSELEDRAIALSFFIGR